MQYDKKTQEAIERATKAYNDYKDTGVQADSLLILPRLKQHHWNDKSTGLSICIADNESNVTISVFDWDF